MKGVKTVFWAIAVTTAIGVLAGCFNPNGPVIDNSAGSIAGVARFSEGNNHGGILVSLEETGGAVAQSVRSVAASGRMANRAIAASTNTNSNGAYEFANVMPGTYTVYASSRDSSEGAVTTGVVVTAGARAVAADLQLTPVGSFSGRIQLDNKETGNLGFLVFLAGTSYMAMTDDAGNFTISGAPAGIGYDVVIMKGNYTHIWVTAQQVNGGGSLDLGSQTIAASDLSGPGAVEGMMLWKGALAAAPVNPQANWVYYNTSDAKLYVYSGSLWVTLSWSGGSGDTTGMMVWKGASAASPANPKQNWVYYNTTVEKLYVYDKSAWVTLSQNIGGMVIWKGSFATAPANPEQNWLYYNTADEKLYVYDGSLWATLSQNNGDISGMMVWLGVSATAPASPQPNWVYYNTADEKLYVYNGSLWVTLSQISDNGDTNEMMVWKGSSAASPANPEQNWVYYNTADKKLYIYDGSLWVTLSQNNGDISGMIIWKGSFATAPANPKQNWAYYNTADKKLYVYDGGLWVTLSQNNGDISGMMVWKGSFATAPASPQPNWVYYNTANEKLYVYNGRLWVTLSQISDNGDTNEMMVWKGSSAASPANPEQNWVYYNTADKKLYIYDGSLWVALSQNSGDISGMMVWKGSSATVPANPGQNWVYYNTADEKLYVYGGGRWQLLADNSDVRPAYGIGLGESGTQIFPAVTAGYAAPAPLSFTIINTGKQNTGALTMGLSGSDADDFTLNATSIAGITPNGTYTFTAAPKTGLAAGTYTALVTVDGANVAAQTFTLYFAVNAVPGYGISLSQTTAHTFPAQGFGYGDQSANALTVTITNTGNQDTGNLSVTVSPTSIFTLSPASITGIGNGSTASFTVKPVTGLAAAAQPYTATVTVSGGANITSRSFGVSFTVNTASFSSVPSISVTPETGGLRVEWSAAVPAPDSYRVYWKKGSHSNPADIRTGPDNGSASGITASNYAISGLDGAAGYSVFVEALKTGYAGGESAVANATAIAGFTGSLDFAVTGITANSLNYSITSSGLSPSNADSYDIYFMEEDQTIANVLSNNVKVNKAALTGSVTLNPGPGAFYTVLAVAKKADYKDSNPSNVVNVVFSPAINLAGAVGRNETYGQGWKYSEGVYTILDGADITLNGTTTSRRLEAEANATADLTLNNARITGIDTGSAFTLGAGATITMTLTGTNELKTSTEGAAGVQTTGAFLTIEGTGSLAAEGGGGGDYGGAGIGGSDGGAGGTITISGSAVVTAQGGGTSYYSYSHSGAGIGGGGGGAGGSITISGSAVVTAQGGEASYYGAGIGGGGGGAGGSITILGGTVIARGGTSTSGIGAGEGGAAGTITPPQNAVVFADSASGLSNNLASGISVGSADIAFNGTFPSFSATVTLQGNMTVPSGAALTVPAGVNLNKNGHTVTGSVVNAGGLVFD